MESWKKEKKILTAFGIFLAFMFSCTLISRAVYASKLPQVSVETPRRMAINHTVTADGIVHQGREYAVTALAGLRVRTVYANVGDRVAPETLLFDLDLEDLKERIADKELQIRKLQLQIAAMEQGKSLEDQKQQTESARAREDYDRADQKAREALEQAREDLEDAEDAYDAHKDHPVQVTSEEERRRQQEEYDAWAAKEKELQDAVDKAREACEKLKDSEEGSSEEADGNPEETEAQKAARETLKQAEQEYEAHMKQAVEKPDFSAEDAAVAAWKEKKEALKSAVEDAKRAEQDAERSRSDTLLDAGRKVADADQPSGADSSLAVSRLELSVLQDELEAYRKVQNASGQVYPEAEGIVTRIQVSPGERVGDGAAVVYADLSSPMQFQVSLTKEQKKYVNQGDMAKITLGGSSEKELTVDYVAENEMNPELYDARVFLPDGLGTIGQSGSFQVHAQSETYSCCIPLDALHEDSSRRTFVYILSEREGILGTELAAEMVYVKVLDQNDTYAALEEGVISRETEIILRSTEELTDRAVVRYKE